MGESVEVATEEAMRELGARLAPTWSAGDVVLLEGPLGVGKTTLVRGIIATLGWQEPVRSPSYNLLHVYKTDPPVVHADLYRLKDASGLGLEDYMDTHLVLIEWPDRMAPMDRTWLITIEFAGDGRRVHIRKP